MTPDILALRAAAERAGYSVHERSSHRGRAWDFSAPVKGPMDANHFKSVDEAWDAACARYGAELARARELLAPSPPPKSPDPMSQEQIALKACPFCGARMVKSDALSNRTNDAYVHERNGCIIDSKVLYSGNPEAVTAWNTRPSPPKSLEGVRADLENAAALLQRHYPPSQEERRDISATLRQAALALIQPTPSADAVEAQHLAPGPWRHDGHGMIWAPSLKGGETHIADIRGWGYLTGRGHGALDLTTDEAVSAQNAWGDLIASAVNAALSPSHPEAANAPCRNSSHATASNAAAPSSPVRLPAGGATPASQSPSESFSAGSDHPEPTPSERGDSAELPRKLVMDNGDTLVREYDTWNRGVTVQAPDGRIATNEQGYELVDSYGLDRLFKAYTAALSAHPAAPINEAGRG